MNDKETRAKIAGILVKWGMPTRQIAIDEILEVLSSQAHALKEQMKACVPKEATEGDGWDIVSMENRCCPGDDCATAFNICREQTLSAIESIEI